MDWWAVVLASGGKVAVSEYYANYGRWPANNGEAGLESATNITGKYVLSVTVTSGVIAAQMKPTGGYSAIQNKTLTLTHSEHSGSVEWACSSTADSKYLPPDCR